MSDRASNAAGAGGKKEKKEIKILMLHGYTQSGPLFRSKTRALEKQLAKTLLPFRLLPTFLYPTAPNRLLPQDVPGYEGPDVDPSDEARLLDTWAWFRKSEATGEYRLLEEGMRAVADAIRDAGEGGIDGVCGFSQGGCLAGLVAAALEKDRPVPEGKQGDWARELREANGGRELRCLVSYSGFWPPPDSLQWCYEPKVSTPSLHFIGSLDSVVVEERSRALVDRCRDAQVVVHPGGHYVPISKEWIMALAVFIKQQYDEPKADL
ncbi:hypothetical protein N3K66_000718 [Trichothecium roseum]|uniref:Uncharacterized protein n=1 Tax=Trichothecium roseum TaxID=47278 RepID=A0ACC0VD14_9HYPO|nr:hypothetical protein N3K66_000718 [Trichothecium roseum]